MLKGWSPSVGEKVLDESGASALVAHCEQAVWVDKRSQRRRLVGDHIGDPAAGFVGPNDRWCVVMGEGITYLGRDGARASWWREQETRFVHSARWETTTSIRVLVDPWSADASVWLFDADDLSLKKLHDGPSLVGEPYRDLVDF